MPERSARPASFVRTVLAFDFGTKRIGVAVGEAQLRTAHPLITVARFAEIAPLVSEWKPDRLVVGRPLSVAGKPHAMTRAADEFARRLERHFQLPVVRVDERFSSVEAESRLRGTRTRKGEVDCVAAQLLLEQYFDEAA